MNRVQTVTQKHHRVENQVEKPSRVHEHPAGPTGTPRCAQERPACAPPGPARPLRSARAWHASAHAPRAAAPRCLQRPPARPTHACLRAPRAPCAPNTCPACAHAFCHNTILYCDTIFPPAALPATIRTSVLQYTSSTQQPLSHNTEYCIAIQTAF